MTISLSDNNPRISYTVNAGVTQTTFTVPFEFFDLDDLKVVCRWHPKNQNNALYACFWRLWCNWIDQYVGHWRVR